MARLEGALKSGAVQWPQTSADELVRQALESPPAVLPFTSEGAGSAKDVPPALNAGSGRSAGPQRRAAPGGRRHWKMAVAASLLLALLGAVLLAQRPQAYRTAVGEQRSVLLADGSLVTLNTASDIEVEFDESRRLVHLRRGEALFQVARDAARPFEVLAGNSTIRAVGTQFNVVTRDAGTTVTVVEGRVAVVSGEPAGSAAPPPQLLLDAAQSVVITKSGAAAPQRIANVAAATAWTQRRLVFERRPLGDVAEEFNRYNRHAIRIVDEALRRQTVTGVFEANDPGSFMQFLAQIPGVRIEESEDGARIVTTNSGQGGAQIDRAALYGGEGESHHER